MTFGGYGYGWDYGSGRGDGDGCCYGGGYGYGYGGGYGYGYVYGERIGVVGKHDAYLLRPWQLLVIGCQAHSLEHWRAHWRAIAAEHGVTINDADAERLLRVAEERARGCADDS